MATKESRKEAKHKNTKRGKTKLWNRERRAKRAKVLKRLARRNASRKIFRSGRPGKKDVIMIVVLSNKKGRLTPLKKYKKG